MTEQDYGELLCYGTNEVGQQLVPCVYQVVAAGTPDPLENCSQVKYALFLETQFRLTLRSPGRSVTNGCWLSQ